MVAKSFMKTPHQKEIMTIILTAADAGEFLTQRQVHDRLSWSCNFGSLRTALKLLERAGMITRDRIGPSLRNYGTVRPTSTAYVVFRAG